MPLSAIWFHNEWFKGLSQRSNVYYYMRKSSVEKGGSLLGTANLEQTKVRQTFQLKEILKNLLKESKLYSRLNNMKEKNCHDFE